MLFKACLALDLLFGGFTRCGWPGFMFACANTDRLRKGLLTPSALYSRVVSIKHQDEKRSVDLKLVKIQKI